MLGKQVSSLLINIIFEIEAQKGIFMKPIFELTQQEYQLFQFLNQQINQTKLEMRIAGGWVRDRLLNKHSNDIDIAVTGMTGLQVATILQQIYLKDHENDKHHLSKISANPEASKHLESATTILFDYSIDFTQLRSEQYSSDSRIPQIHSTDSIVVDCLRRDLTINALYYNIETDMIEDYCNGIEDLKNKIIRTPLEPYKTLNEDPLRIVRVLRFKSKLIGYQINDQLNQALHNKEIVDRLNIVAYERIHQEIQKGLINNYVSMIKVISQYQLVYQTLLQYKNEQQNLQIDLIQRLLNSLNLMQLKEDATITDHEALILGITILSLPITQFYDIIFENVQALQENIDQAFFQYKESQMMLLSQSKDVKVNGSELLYVLSLFKQQQIDDMQKFTQIVQYIINNQTILNLCYQLKIFQQVFDKINEFYINKMQIFSIKFKVNINDVAKRLQITQKDQYQPLKNKFQLLVLQSQEYPQYNFNDIINKMIIN